MLQKEEDPEAEEMGEHEMIVEEGKVDPKTGKPPGM